MFEDNTKTSMAIQRFRNKFSGENVFKLLMGTLAISLELPLLTKCLCILYSTLPNVMLHRFLLFISEGTKYTL